MTRWIVLGVAAILAAAVGVYFGLSGQSTRDASTLLELSLPDTSGHQEALSQWKGKVLVVNFWATWCAPCREEMPEFVKAQAELGPRGLQFVGIAVDEPDKAERFAQELGVNYPVLIGGYGAIELSRTLGNRVVALPFTVVVDRRGRVAQTHLGPFKPTELRAIVTNLL
jgi:peroxiredoxin